MFFNNGLKHVFITLGIIAVISFFIGYVNFSGIYEKEASLKPDRVIDRKTDSEKRAPLHSPPEKMIRIVEARTLYTLCGHIEPLSLGDLNGMSLEELGKKFPRRQGWVIEEAGSKILITQKLDTLCSDCEGKRHLGAFGDFVAVVKGPVGVEGGIVEVTNIKIEDLPPQWQEQIKRGRLDFSSAQEMLEALDSLDEYHN